jgi:hypothetical protein
MPFLESLMADLRAEQSAALQANEELVVKPFKRFPVPGAARTRRRNPPSNRLPKQSSFCRCQSGVPPKTLTLPHYLIRRHTHEAFHPHSHHRRVAGSGAFAQDSTQPEPQKTNKLRLFKAAGLAALPVQASPC